MALSKFKVLNIITQAAVLQPGNIHKWKKYWFISIKGFIYLLITSYLFVNLCTNLKRNLDSYEPPAHPPQNMGNSTDEEFEDLPPPPPGGEFHNDTKETSSAEQVTAITATSSEILSSVVTLVNRLFILFHFAEIVNIFRSLMLREFCSASYKWSRDEFLVFILLILSISIHVVLTLQGYYERGLRLPFNRRGFSVRRLWGILFAIQGCIDCFLSNSFPTECIAFVLVIFTTVVAHNIQELSTYLEADDVSREDTRKGVDSLLEFEFPREFQMYYTTTRKHVMARDGGRQAGVDPIFIVRTKKMSKEPEILPTDVNCLLRRYLDWFNLWKQSEVITGVLALIIFLSMTVNLCISAFTFISAFLDSKYSEIFPTLTNAILNGVYLFCLCNTAQFLLDASEELEEKLIMESWKETSFFRSDISQVQKEKQLSYLLHHMTQNPINLSALGFFTASRSTLTSIGGVIVTYLVVLIQFRTSGS